MKKYFIHNPIFRIAGPAVYGVFVYLLVLLINNSINQLQFIFSTQEIYICIALTYISFEVVRVVIILADRWLPEKFATLKISVQLLASISLSTGSIAVGLTTYFQQVVGFSISSSQLLIFSVIYVITALLYNLLYFSNYFLQKENTLKLTSEKQQREVLEMEMAEFKNEINTDLLYESLEGIISLMYHDKEKAEEHIDNLASAYRYSLTNRKRELVDLSEELQAAQNIIHLLNEKYFGRVKLNATLSDSDYKLMLIPGSLPMSVEYLIRNTIITLHEPLAINLYIEDDQYLTLQSKLNDRLVAHQESLTALLRLQKSYSLYNDLPLIQVKAYEENYIKLPLVRVGEEILTIA